MSAYIGSDGDGTRLWDITGHDNLLANVTWLTASEIQQYFSWSASATDIKFSNNSIYFSNLSNTAKSFNININNIPKKYIGFYFSSSSSLDISTLAMGPGDILVTFTFQNTNTITAFQSATGTGDGTVGCIFDSKKEENITANFKIRAGDSSYYCYIFLLDDLSIFSEIITTSDNKAHNISKAYIGVPTEKTKDVPRQETTTKTISCTVNDANTASQYKKLSDLFTITNGSSYYFANTNTESTNNYSTYKSNNGGQDNTTASTTLTALHDFSALSFGYSYSGESNYDYVTLTVGGTTIESKASGSTTNKTWSGTLSKGQTIEITYTKDSSYNKYDDCGTIYNIQATYQTTVTETIIDKVGTGEYANLARKVKAIYIGDVNGKAKLCFLDNSISELTQEWTSPGTYTVTIPKWANKAKITACGAGGGGGVGYRPRGNTSVAGGGGGAAILNSIYDISSNLKNTSITIIVGAKGIGGYVSYISDNDGELDQIVSGTDGGTTQISAFNILLGGGKGGANIGYSNTGQTSASGGSGGGSATAGSKGQDGICGIGGSTDNESSYRAGGGGGSLGTGGDGSYGPYNTTYYGYDGIKGGGGGGVISFDSDTKIAHHAGDGGNGYVQITWLK